MLRRVINFRNVDGEAIMHAIERAEKEGKETLWLFNAEVEVIDLE